MNRPPNVRVSFENLPDDAKQRHEALVNVFGEYLFWVRNQAIQQIRMLVESPEEREKLGRLFRHTYEDASKLSPEDRKRAYALAESALTHFAKMFLTMISGQGFDDAIGSNHVFRYRLEMEICDSETGAVVFEETINRGGEKFFPEYWGRWLNQFGHPPVRE